MIELCGSLLRRPLIGTRIHRKRRSSDRASPADGLLFNKHGIQPEEETQMKRNILITAALAMLAITAASAQTVKLKATVPFSFIVGRFTLPAGEYSLKTMSNGQVLAMSNLDAKTTQLVLSNACESLTASNTK